MRKQRFGLIQTPDQLRFSYIAILQVYMYMYMYVYNTYIYHSGNYVYIR